MKDKDDKDEEDEEEKKKAEEAAKAQEEEQEQDKEAEESNIISMLEELASKTALDLSLCRLTEPTMFEPHIRNCKLCQLTVVKTCQNPHSIQQGWP